MVKAGSSLIRSPLTVVMVCPGGFGSEPGPGWEPGAADGGVAAMGGTTAETGDRTRGPMKARGPGAAAARLGGAGLTTTSGTGTEPDGAAAGGLASDGAGGEVDWLVSGLGASVASGGLVGDSWVRRSVGTRTAAVRTAAKGQKRCQANMAHSENTQGKDERVVRDGRYSVARIQPIRLLLSRSAEIGRACRRATLVSTRGRIKFDYAALLSRTDVRGRHDINGRNNMVDRQDRARRVRQCAKHTGRCGARWLVREILTICRAVPIAVTNDEQVACNGADRHGVCAGEASQQYLERECIGSHHGDPWSQAASRFAQLQHQTTPRQPSLAFVGGSTEDERSCVDASSPLCVVRWQQ